MYKVQDLENFKFYAMKTITLLEASYNSFSQAFIKEIFTLEYFSKVQEIIQFENVIPEYHKGNLVKIHLVMNLFDGTLHDMLDLVQ